MIDKFVSYLLICRRWGILDAMDMIALLCAVIAAPIVGGGFGELTNGLIQLAVYSALAFRLLVSRGRANLAVPPGAVLLGGLCIVTVASLVVSVSFYHAAKQSLLALAGVVTYMITADRCRSRAWASAVLWSVVLCGLGVCLYSIRQYAISTGGGAQFWAAVLGPSEAMRMFGTFVNPGFFSGFLAIALVVAVGVCVGAGSTRASVLAAVSCVFITVSLLLTGTKFGAVSAAAGLLVFLVVAAACRALTGRDLRRLAILALVLIPLAVAFSGPLRHRVTAAGASGSQVHSTAFRIYTWKSTLKMIEAKPVLGFGPGSFDIVFPRFAIAGLTKHAHQSYLQLGAESGAAAPILLCAALLVILVHGVRGVSMLRDNRPEAYVPPGTVQNQGQGQIESSFLCFGTSVPKHIGGYASRACAPKHELIDPERWRVVNAAIVGAIVASCTRSLVDSDWYLAGIWIPFWALAGVLAGQTSPMRTVELTNRFLGYLAGGMACLLAAAGLTFGCGDAMLSASSSDSGLSGRVARLRAGARCSPLNPRLHRELGKALLLEENDGTGAVQQISRAIRLSPQDGAGYFARGNVYQHLGLVSKAISDFKTALRLNPHSTQVMLRLAECYVAKGDARGTESVYERLIAQENTTYERVKGVPEMVDTSYAVAHIYFADKCRARAEWAPASDYYLAAIARLERWQSNENYIQIGLYSGAISEQEITRNAQMLRSAYLGLADCYEAVGDAQRASEFRGKASAVKDFLSE